MKLLGLFLPKQRVFADLTQFLALMPGIFGEYLRLAFLQWVLPRCGRNSCIGFGTIFSHPTAEIGENVYVGPYCILGDVTLGDDVLLASGVSIANGTNQHFFERTDVPIREQGGEYPRVTIGEDSWIGERAVILADVGAHCVIGAGALVLESIPDYAIAVGVPAKVVKFRNNKNPDGEEIIQ
ncbi:MAG: acyltransferase [Thermoguttaceae bacterium]|nr:acyltransferase [Thermoguttaceae bacterium]